MKKHDIVIRLIESEEIPSLLPIISLINPSIPEKKLTVMLEEMVQSGYRCAATFEKERCVGVIGIWIHTKFYVGKHAEYDNVFLLPKYRKKGIGKKMLKFANGYAKAQGCVAAELSCDVLEKGSQKFWEKIGFDTIGYRYQKSLIG
ncbi:MAG: GNAT family N-acetyltransferase [Campylobacterota bacterium]|nr:GNAT family N-acetyltransferase [Campylobacterota bacterium]